MLPAGRPVTQYLPPGSPGYRNVGLYGVHPDLARARKLAGRGRHHAVLVTCSKAPCPQWGAIIRDDLRKIGIGVTVVESADFFPKEPYDLHFLFWGPDYPDPANVLNPLLLGNQSPPRGVNFSYFDNPVYNRRLEAAAELTGPAREAAYARLDADLTGKEAPMIAFDSLFARDLFSARMGCQIYQPQYGMDLAALCVRRPAGGA